MITANASSSIEWLFEKAVRDSAVCMQDDHCVVTRATEMAPTIGAETHRLVVLNISSYVFRIVALFEFDTDAATVAHLAKITRSTDKLEGQALQDAYGEFVNMICGAVNRSLCAQFRHVGMSTPFILESSCAQYLSMLDPTQLQWLEVTINGAVHFKLALCTCVASNVTLDFSVDRFAQNETTSGELELF